MPDRLLYVTVILAWTSTGPTEDSVGAKAYWQEGSCKLAAQTFAHKHKIPVEPCVRMRHDKYTKHIAQVEATFAAGPDWPIVGGYVRKKRGKRWIYTELGDTRKE